GEPASMCIISAIAEAKATRIGSAATVSTISPSATSSCLCSVMFILPGLASSLANQAGNIVPRPQGRDARQRAVPPPTAPAARQGCTARAVLDHDRPPRQSPGRRQPTTRILSPASGPPAVVAGATTSPARVVIGHDGRLDRLRVRCRRGTASGTPSLSGEAGDVAWVRVPRKLERRAVIEAFHQRMLRVSENVFAH